MYLAGTVVGRKRGATQVKLQNTCTRAHHQRIQEQLCRQGRVNPMWFRHGGLQNNVITGGKYPCQPNPLSGVIQADPQFGSLEANPEEGIVLMPEVGSPPTHPPVLAGPCVYHRML